MTQLHMAFKPNNAESLIDISTASSVGNVGAIFDSALSSEALVNSICKSAWFNSFNISRSRRSLTTDAVKILIQAYVMSKIDHCNSLLYGIPDKLFNRSQRIQNYDKQLLSPPPCRLKTYGDRAFWRATPLRNNIPTLWRLPRMLIVLKWNYSSIF